MRIEPRDSETSTPQFIVYAETPSERLLLREFCNTRRHHNDGLVFQFHGAVTGSDYDGVSSFNFGWARKVPAVSVDDMRAFVVVKREAVRSALNEAKQCGTPGTLQTLENAIMKYERAIEGVSRLNNSIDYATKLLAMSDTDGGVSR